MELPDPLQLRAVLAEIRDADLQAAGVTHLRLGAIEVKIAPKTDGQRIVAELNEGAPLPGDRAVEIRKTLTGNGETPTTKTAVGIMERLAAGLPLTTDETQPPPV